MIAIIRWFAALVSKFLLALIWCFLRFLRPEQMHQLASKLMSKLLSVEIIPPLSSRKLLSKILDIDLDKKISSEIHDSVINFSSYQRDEWVKNKAKDIPGGLRLLDAGAGQCRYRDLFQHLEYKTQDFAQYEGTGDGLLKETWNYGKLDYVCDITAIPVPAESFDVVLCTEVLEHVPEPIDTLRELVRVLAPGGKLLITVPLGSGLHQEPYHFYGGFSPYFFKHHLEKMGVDVVEALPLGGLLKHVGQEIHRVGQALNNCPDVKPELVEMMQKSLPHLLFTLDDRFFIEQFTVGYLIEARKAC